jgi:ABC-type sugar transport system ATPase subunit
MSNVVRNNSFSIFEGQITGVFGLIGSGRTETFKIVSGIYKRDFRRGGAIELDDRPVRYVVPSEAVADGIVYVTEDRKSEGIFETMGIDENLFGGLLAAGREKAWVINAQEMRALSSEWTKTLNIKAINDNARVVELSGGNQQKVVIGKGLVQKPRIVIFDEPTRGVDVGAIAEIHQIINRLADEGLAVVVISSYLPEIMNLSDRILVAARAASSRRWTSPRRPRAASCMPLCTDGAPARRQRHFGPMRALGTDWQRCALPTTCWWGGRTSALSGHGAAGRARTRRSGRCLRGRAPFRTARNTPGRLARRRDGVT